MKYDRDRNLRSPGGARYYAGVGVYFFESPADGASTEPALTRRARGREKRMKRTHKARDA
jgi:hypothetical protein